MPGQPWFRMYARILEDSFVQELSFEDQRHFALGILSLKCDGTLDRAKGEKALRRIIARRLRIDGRAVAGLKKRLLAQQLVDLNWSPTGWERLQYKSDSSTSRSRKYRKNKETGNVAKPLLQRPRDRDRDRDRKESVILDSSSVESAAEIASRLDENGTGASPASRRTLGAKVDALLDGESRQLFERDGRINIDLLAKTINVRDGKKSDPSQQFRTAVLKCVRVNEANT